MHVGEVQCEHDVYLPAVIRVVTIILYFISSSFAGKT